MRDRNEALEILACDITERPRGAPGITDLARFVQAVQRTNGSLVIEFAAAQSSDVEAFVDAERRCCADIDWRLERTPATLLLRITTTAPRLEILDQLFTHEGQIDKVQ